MILSCIVLELLMMKLVRLSHFRIMKLFLCLMSVEQRLRIPPRKTATLSLDFNLSIAGYQVFCLAGSGRFFVVCKGFRPTRVSGSCLCINDKKWTFEASSYDECISLFLDLSKELLRRVPIL